MAGQGWPHGTHGEVLEEVRRQASGGPVGYQVLARRAKRTMLRVGEQLEAEGFVVRMYSAKGHPWYLGVRVPGAAAKQIIFTPPKLDDSFDFLGISTDRFPE